MASPVTLPDRNRPIICRLQLDRPPARHRRHPRSWSVPTRSMIVEAAPWIREPESPDSGHGFVPTTGPGGHVAKGVRTGVQPEVVADHVGGRFRLQLGQPAVRMILMEQSVGHLVGEGLDPLGRSVSPLDPDPAELERAVPVDPVRQFGRFDRKAEGVGGVGQAADVGQRFVADELVT